MRSPQSFRYVLPAAFLGVAICVMAAAVVFGEEEGERICPELVEIVVPLTHKGVRYEALPAIVEVPVPCEKPPSSARVELGLNPVPVDGEQGVRW